MIIENDMTVETPVSNTMLGDAPVLENSTIRFRGSGNILFSEPDVTLKDSDITFYGDNALLYLSASNKREYRLHLDLWSGTAAYFGSNNYFNGTLNAIVSERRNLIIGGGGVFSFGIWMRTADPHLIYDIESRKRINMSRSILIGDHVWLGQNAFVLKGSKVGSGSVISAACVLANKEVESNTVYAGNPARKIRENIFYIGKSVHNYTAPQTEASLESKSDKHIYGKKGAPLAFEEIDDELIKAAAAEEKLEIIQNRIITGDRDRFAISAGGRRAGLFRKNR